MENPICIILIILGGSGTFVYFFYRRFLIRSILEKETKVGYYYINIWEKELIEMLKKHGIGNTRKQQLCEKFVRARKIYFSIFLLILLLLGVFQYICPV